MFNLPAYQQLSPEQDSIYFLPLEGRHLIAGPPGTGKTVLAIYRAQRARKEEQQTRFIVHNNTLMQCLQPAATQAEVDASTNTYFSWFSSWYNQLVGEWAPQVKPWVFDWPAILSRLTCLGSEIAAGRIDHLIVDEGQDLPPEAWTVLRMTATNMTVFADENQRITQYNSTLDDIRQRLGLDKAWPIRKNYRNTRPIAEFAARFYTGLRTEVPDLPDRTGPKPRVIYTGTDMKREVQQVVMYAVARPRSDIGVLLPYVKQMKPFYDFTRAALASRGSALPVQMYLSGDRDHGSIDFSVPGIKILSYASAKGLEFDAVYLPRVDRNLADPTSKETKMMFFTLTSRARNELTIMHTGESLPAVLSDVPAALFDRSALN